MSGGYLFCADRSGAETEKPVTNYNILWTWQKELIEMLSKILRKRG